MSDLADRLRRVLRQRPLCMQQHDLARDLLAIEERRMDERALAAQRAQQRPPIVLGDQCVRDRGNTGAALTLLAALCVLVLALWGGA